MATLLGDETFTSSSEDAISPCQDVIPGVITGVIIPSALSRLTPTLHHSDISKTVICDSSYKIFSSQKLKAIDPDIKMKFTLSSVVLAGVLSSAFSFSYLESLSKKAPAPVQSNGVSYLDALSKSSQSGAPRGTGLTSYLDALPKNPASAVRGSGMTSYTDALNSAKPTASTPASPVTPPSQPAAPSSFKLAESAQVVSSGGNYLEALAKSTKPIPGGAGLTSYLDALPRSASATRGGAGIRSYVDNLKSVSVTGGAGLRSYTDVLNGGSASSSSSSYAPAYSSLSSSSMETGAGFTIEAENLAALLSQIKGSSGTLNFSGDLKSLSLN